MKKTFKKYILLFSTLTVVLICLSGFTNKETPLFLGLKNLKEKYGIEFTFVEPVVATMVGNSSQVIVSTEELPGKEIILQITKNEDGTYTFQDNYLTHFYEK